MLNNVNKDARSYGEKKHVVKDYVSNSRHVVNDRTYVYAVKEGKANEWFEEQKKLVIVLDESCILHKDFSLSMFGKVKEFSSLSNLKMILAIEGFNNVNVYYMGGFWVVLEFQSLSSKEKFTAHVGVGSWFDTLQQASNSFNLDGRVAWVDIKGVPLKVWTKNTFNRIISKWGELLYEEEKEDSCFHRKRVCIKTTLDEIIFESFKVIVQGKVYWVQAKEVTGWNLDFREEETCQTDSEDGSLDEDSIGENEVLNKNAKLDVEFDVEEIPKTVFEQEQVDPIELHFNIEGTNGGTNDKDGSNGGMNGKQLEDPFNSYDLLEKQQDKDKEVMLSEDVLKYPPGFTPKEHNDVSSNSIGIESGEVNKESKHDKKYDLDSATKICKETSIVKEDVETSTCRVHFSKTEIPRSGGSIIQAMEDLIKIGQVMGYKMESCSRNIEEIIQLRGENEVNR
ncbi:nucleotide-binding alpha-beta plait domain-containing protein [Tanacetum coccineum]